MKSRKLPKLVGHLLILVSLLTLAPIGASAEWKENNTGWKLIDGKYYYFTVEGTKVCNTTVDGYYLGSDGAKVTTQGSAKLQDIKMKAEKSVYELGTKDIDVYIINNTSLESGYGTRYEVDKLENNEWHCLDFAEDAKFEEIVALLLPKRTYKENYKLSALKDFKNLTSGKYRIVKEISNSDGYSHVTAEFELQ